MRRETWITTGCIVLAALAVPGRASADGADTPDSAKPTHQAMQGPAKTAFDEMCAKAKAAAKHDEGGGDVTCKQIAQGKQKPFTAVELWSIETNDRKYYLAVQTPAGWFVTTEPLAVSVGDGAAGHGYDLDSVQVTLRQLAAGRGRAVAAALTLKYKYWSEAGDHHSRATYHAFILAGIGSSGPRSLVLDGFNCRNVSVTVKGGYQKRSCDDSATESTGMFSP